MCGSVISITLCLGGVFARLAFPSISANHLSPSTTNTQIFATVTPDLCSSLLSQSIHTLAIQRPIFNLQKKRNIFNWVFYSCNSFTHGIQLGVSCHIFLDNIWHNLCCCKFCKFSSACLWWLQQSSDGTEEQKDGGGRFPLPPYCFHLHHQLLHQNVGAFHFILLFDSLHLPRLPLCMTCLWCKIILSFLFISERHMHNCCYYPSQIYWSCCFFTFCFLECIYFSDEIIFFQVYWAPEKCL